MQYHNILYYLDALCGAGKTYAATRYAYWLARRGNKVLVVQPCKELINKTVREELSKLSPAVRHTVLHGDEVRLVVPAIVSHFKETPPGGEILFITHQGFLRTPFFQGREKWIVIWDEYPQIDQFSEFHIPNTGELIVPLIDLHSHDARYSVASPAIGGGRARLKEIAENKDDDQVWKLFKDFTDRLLSPKWTTSVLSHTWENLRSGQGKQRRVTSHSMLQPSMFDGFERVIMLGACFEESLMNHVWSAQGVRFKPFRSKHFTNDLRYQKHLNGGLLRIKYATDEPWSKALRDRVLDEAAGTTVLDAILEKVRAEVGDEPFVWMGNKDLGDGTFNGLEAERLPNSPHGRNDFQDFHTAVILSALNPPPAHFAFLESKGVNGAAVRTGGYRQATYQAVMRCSLRNPDDLNPKTVIVMDRDTAEWLAALFPGCSVSPLGGAVIGAVLKKSGRPKVHASSAARKAAHRRDLETRLLIEQDIINGDDLTADFYPDLTAIIRAEMPELNGLAAEDQVAWGDAEKGGGTIFTSLYDPVPFAHLDREDDESFIAGLRSFHDRFIPAKEDAGLISPAFFDSDKDPDTSRGLANVRHVRGVWLDNDGGDLTPDEFARLFPFFRVVVWNTYSSTLSKPRWRAFIPTTQAMSMRVHALILAQIMKALNKAGYWSKEQLAKNPAIRKRNLHGFDASKFNAASLFFLPAKARDPAGSFFHDYGEGNPKRGPIEPYVWIKKSIVHPEPEPVAPAPTVATRSPAPICAGGSPKLQKIRAALANKSGENRREEWRDEAIEEWRTKAFQSGQGNQAFFALGAALQRAGLDQSEIKQVLEEEAPFARNSGQRKGEIKNIMRSLTRSPRLRRR
jgi:hypothetical protein